MTVLYLDVGNSRVKWLTVGADGTRTAMNAVVHAGAVAEAIAAAVADSAPEVVVAVDVTATLPQGLPDGLPLRVFTATETVAGLKNGYDDPARLGADRWAAVVGAWQHDAVLVIDAGTAITADLVDASGRHRGGWIAPGRALATKSLTTSTRGIRMGDAPAVSGDQPGTDTDHAVAGGAVLAARGFAIQAAQAARQTLGAEPRIVLTGGDAPLLAAVLPGASVVEDLVLRGLMVWAEDQR